jgi:hypothetical protein
MKKLITLSGSGVVSDVRTLLAKLYGYYITFDHDRSILFNGNISSLRHTISKNIRESDVKLESEVSIELTNYLNRYFYKVDVDVSVSDTFSLDVSIKVTEENGSITSLRDVIKYENNSVFSEQYSTT